MVRRLERTTVCPLCKLSLCTTACFKDIERVTGKFNLIHKVNVDELYDKCTAVNIIPKGLREDA